MALFSKQAFSFVKMKFPFFACFLIISNISVVLLNTDDEFCSSDGQCTTVSKVKASESDNLKWLTSVRNAEESYVACASSNCSCYLRTLREDLQPFQSGITSKMVEQIRSKGTTYVVYKNRLFRSKECVFPARCSGVEYFIKSLLPKLPDMEFILNSRDWPQISKYMGDKGPVLSFSKTPDYLDIQFPAWSFWEGGPAIKLYPRGLGRWDVMRDNLAKENKQWPWERKLQKGFFRGSRTSDERDALVLLSRVHPTLVDAQYTKNQAWKSAADTLNAEPASEVSLEDHCRYKYLFNMRGVAASFRFKHLFLCGSLVIHFGDEWTEFFYGALKPWIHYVPVAADASQQDILKLLAFLRDHDELARKIALQGHDFIREHLRLKDVRCYWRVLLKRYQKLIRYPIELDSNLVEIK